MQFPSKESVNGNNEIISGNKFVIDEKAQSKNKTTRKQTRKKTAIANVILENKPKQQQAGFI